MPAGCAQTPQQLRWSTLGLQPAIVQDGARVAHAHTAASLAACMGALGVFARFCRLGGRHAAGCAAARSASRAQPLRLQTPANNILALKKLVGSADCL